jgi:hypothetical protein
MARAATCRLALGEGRAAALEHHEVDIGGEMAEGGQEPGLFARQGDDDLEFRGVWQQKFFLCRGKTKRLD